MPLFGLVLELRRELKTRDEVKKKKILWRPSGGGGGIEKATTCDVFREPSPVSDGPIQAETKVYLT